MRTTYDWCINIVLGPLVLATLALPIVIFYRCTPVSADTTTTNHPPKGTALVLDDSLITDVAAMRLKDKVTSIHLPFDEDGSLKIMCIARGGKVVENNCQITAEQWTCADKSRILLTSEDGRRHCMKFNIGWIE